MGSLPASNASRIPSPPTTPPPWELGANPATRLAAPVRLPAGPLSVDGTYRSFAVDRGLAA